MRAGQRLTAHASTRETRIDRLSDPVAPSARGCGAPGGESESRRQRISVGRARRPPPHLRATGAEARLGRSEAAGGARGAGRAHAAAAVREVSASWAARVSSGAFRGVVEDADSPGVERCLAEVSAPALAALADAARYVRRTELARRALLAERRRFAVPPRPMTPPSCWDGWPTTPPVIPARRCSGTTATWKRPRTGLTPPRRSVGRCWPWIGWGRTRDARAAAEAYQAAFPDGPHASRAAPPARPPLGPRRERTSADRPGWDGRAESAVHDVECEPWTGRDDFTECMRIA